MRLQILLASDRGSLFATQNSEAGTLAMATRVRRCNDAGDSAYPSLAKITMTRTIGSVPACFDMYAYPQGSEALPKGTTEIGVSRIRGSGYWDRRSP